VASQFSERRLGEQVNSFSDPDGLKLELVAGTEAEARGVLAAGPVPPEYSIRGFHGITLSATAHEQTATLLADVMGFRAAGSDGDRFRYRAAGNAGVGSAIDILRVTNAAAGSVGPGVVHHVAFRTPDDQQQEAWRQRLLSLGYHVSPVMDRNYFHSIYYREPGGVLFEIATDPPGFTVDQKPEELGTRLMLPPWLEPHRARIERILPPVRVPGTHAEVRG